MICETNGKSSVRKINNEANLCPWFAYNKASLLGLRAWSLPLTEQPALLLFDFVFGGLMVPDWYVGAANHFGVDCMLKLFQIIAVRQTKEKKIHAGKCTFS